MNRPDPRPHPYPHRRGISLAFVCLMLLGAMPVISNARPAGTTALTFALWLTGWQVVFAVPLQVREWRRGERGVLAGAVSPAARRRLLAVTLFTGALFALSTWAYVLAFERAGTVNAAIGLQVYPLFAATLEALFLGRRKRPAELAWTGVILGALYGLATAGTWRMSGLSPWFGLALAVPALWSIAHVVLRQALVSTPITPNQVTSSRLLVSGLCLLPITVFVDGPSGIARAGADLHLQVFALLMGAAYYLELIVWFHAVRHIEVSLASTITVPAPAVTMALAVVLLGEPAHGYQVSALVVVAVALVGLLRAGQPRASPASSGLGRGWIPFGSRAGRIPDRADPP